ncbi:MAG: pyruvate kinase alpha/beta domain-containing protein [Fimbriimonadaceae bacterium]
MAGNSDETTSNAINTLLRCKRLHVGDSVLITAGVPAGTPGHTNLIHHLTVK